MSKSKEKQLPNPVDNAAVCRQLWTDVVKAEASRDYERAFKLCNRLIKLDDTSDKTVHWCKAVCLIQMSKFDDALNVIKKNGLQESMGFEKAYCEYRLNRFEESFKTAMSNDDDFRCKELLAQICYRQEKYEESLNYYSDLLRDHEDDYEEERQVNLSAVQAQLGDAEGCSPHAATGDVGHDLLYNEACRLLAAGRPKDAALVLKTAEKVCQDTLDEDEVEEELPLLRTQLAYALQIQEQVEAAYEINQDIVKLKPSDATLIAVASNNIVAAKGLQSIWDSRKKMKACSGRDVLSKLNSRQKMDITLNNALVNFHGNQIESCRTDIAELSKFPASEELVALMKASLAIREKKLEPAVANLNSLIESTSDPSENIVLTLAQLQLSDGKFHEAVETLAPLSSRPGILSVCLGAKLAVSQQAAMEWLSLELQKHRSKPELQKIIHEELARLAIQSGDFPRATENLQALRRLDPHNPSVLAKLIKVYSQYDLAKAEALAAEAEDAGSANLHLDMPVDELESTSWLALGARRAKKGVKSPEQGDVKKKRKKKHKVKLPKNYDPNVQPDPERWLPRRERSGFKRRKDKRTREKEISRGPQGTVSAADVASLDASQKKADSPATPKSPQTGGAGGAAPRPPPGTAGPRGQRPAAKKGKKKGGKDKW